MCMGSLTLEAPARGKEKEAHEATSLIDFITSPFVYSSPT